MGTPDLKQGLANVLAERERSKRDALVARTDAALAKIDGELAAAMRHVILNVDVPSEPLERLLSAAEDARHGIGRPAKDATKSAVEAVTAAAVDALIGSDKSLSLKQACEKVAAKTRGNLNWKKLRTLRSNIMGGKAPRDAVDCYHWRRNGTPTQTLDPPAPMTLDEIEQMWDALAAKE
ncbi:hypothetical protein NKI88_04375 [Mesorhizobium sp. M0317]|uniref:hypothetical protein n=1 Tax=Mesorhizobium sp. M0317 TaxID=2956935 RepID=UPI0033383F43